MTQSIPYKANRIIHKHLAKISKDKKRNGNCSSVDRPEILCSTSLRIILLYRALLFGSASLVYNLSPVVWVRLMQLIGANNQYFVLTPNHFKYIYSNVVIDVEKGYG